MPSIAGSGLYSGSKVRWIEGRDIKVGQDLINVGPVLDVRRDGVFVLVTTMTRIWTDGGVIDRIQGTIRVHDVDTVAVVK